MPIEVFSPGFAGRGRPGEGSLQVRALGQRSAECPLPGACAEGPRRKSLTTRRSPDQRRPPHPSTGCGLLVRKPHWVEATPTEPGYIELTGTDCVKNFNLVDASGDPIKPEDVPPDG